MGIKERVEKKHPNSYFIDDCYGYVYTKQGNFNEAKRSFLKVIKKLRRPGDLSKYRYRLGTLSLWQRKYEDSLEFARVSLLDDPENKSAFQLLKNIVYHFTITNIFYNNFFRLFLIQRKKYQDIYPSHPITKLEYLHLQNVITKAWNNEIFSGEEKIQQIELMGVKEWYESIEIDFGPVYEKMKNYKKDDLIIKFDINNEEQDGFFEDQSEDEDDETDDGSDGLSDDDEDDDFDDDDNEVTDGEGIFNIISLATPNSHLNSEFILALIYLTGMPLKRANEFYFKPIVTTKEENEILTWANEILDMIYELKYRYQSILDPEAKESIDKIKAAASIYLDKKLSDGVINQLLRFIESIVTKGKKDAGNKNLPNYVGLN